MSSEATPTKPNPEDVPNPDIYAAVMEIAAALGETAAAPKYEIDRIIEHCGEAFAREVLAETQAVEAAGGMKTQDGSRRRSPGGVFFYLARGRMTKEQKELVFWRPKREAKKRYKKRQGKQAAAFPWDERMKMLNALLKQPGPGTSVRTTLIGRPAHIKRRDRYVEFEMAQTIAAGSYPRGVPKPPEAPVTYTVYASAKQWRRVDDVIKDDRKDKLIVEGKCAFDPARESVAVFATFVSTVALEQAKREQQRAKAAEAAQPVTLPAPRE